MQSFCKTPQSSWRLIQLFGEVYTVLQETGEKRWQKATRKKSIIKPQTWNPLGWDTLKTFGNFELRLFWWISHDSGNPTRQEIFSSNREHCTDCEWTRRMCLSYRVVINFYGVLMYMQWFFFSVMDAVKSSQNSKPILFNFCSYTTAFISVY